MVTLLPRLVDNGKAIVCAAAAKLGRSVRVAFMSRVGQGDTTEPKSMETPYHLHLIVVVVVVVVSA